LGTIGIISAAQNSLPGDPLYTLKTVFEKTQMTFASGEESKAGLSIKFANQRMDEFAQIASKPEKKDNIEKTVQNLNAQLVTVQENMDKLKAVNSAKAAEVAKLISAQADSYKETLTQTTDRLAYMMPEERDKIKTEIDQILVEVNKTQEQANAIIKTEEGKTDVEPIKEDTVVSPSPTFETINP
jgi:primase-polymerase (primpol)-like protein